MIEYPISLIIESVCFKQSCAKNPYEHVDVFGLERTSVLNGLISLLQARLVYGRWIPVNAKYRIDERSL